MNSNARSSFKKFVSQNRAFYYAAIALIVLLIVGIVSYFGKNILTYVHDETVDKTLSKVSYTENDCDKNITLLEPYTEEQLLSAQSRGNLYKALTELAFMKGDNSLYNHYTAYALYYLAEADDTDSVVYLNNKYIGLLYSNGCYSAAEEILAGLADQYDISTFEPEMQSSYFLSCADVAQMLEKDSDEYLQSARKAIDQMEESGQKKIQQAKLDLLTARKCILSEDIDQAEKVIENYIESDDFGLGEDQVYVVCDYRIPFYEITAKILLARGDLEEAYVYIDKYLDACNVYSFRVMSTRMLQTVVDATKSMDTTKAEMYRTMAADSLKENMTEMSDAYGQFLVEGLKQTINEVKSWEGSSRKTEIRGFLGIGFCYIILILYCLISFLLNTMSNDGLTGLGNRKKYDKHMKAFANKKRPYKILILDIDNFKRVNDELGHQMGDLVLRNVASILLNFEDKGINGYRYGGEEMVLVMTEITDKDFRGIAEKVRATVEQKAGPEGRTVTVSIGLASSEDGRDVFAEADKNLYEAKNSGKNRVVG